jgi:hypothetical protein
MLLGATACVWLEGALCHEKLLIVKIYCGPEIRGKQGCNGRGLGISGSNWPQVGRGLVRVVDNQLLFPPNPSTFHSRPQANRFGWELAGLNLGFRPQGVDNPVDEEFGVIPGN